MPLIQLLITIAVIGVICWLLITYLPMPEPIKKIIIAVAVIAIVLYLLTAFGLLGNISTIRIGK